MNLKKTALLVLGSNLLWLGALVAVLALTQPAQASAPASTQAGPYYATFSGADFQSYRYDFEITRNAYAVARSSPFGIGVTGLNLPPGATITALTNDSNAVSGGDPALLLFQCALGGTNCTELARATQNTAGRTQVTTTLNHAVNSADNTYFLQVNLDDDSLFYYGRVAYTLPAPLFLPAIAR